MSVYFTKGKGWRYDFTLRGNRHTEAWFPTKTKAKEAEAERRKELATPATVEETPTDMGFLDLVNRRLDHVKAYNSPKHYNACRYLAQRWNVLWGELRCSQVNQEMIEGFILVAAKKSAQLANKQLRYLRAMINFGKKKKLISHDPTEGVDFLPVVKKVKCIPPVEDIDRVLAVADPETRDYLWTICDTMARVSEINRLTWDDVDIVNKQVILYTRKKRGGHLTPRTVPMTPRLFDILSRRFRERDKSKPWVFWHSYWSRKAGARVAGPFGDRKKVMKRLCSKAGVRYFRFHALRHSGASLLDNERVPIGTIQRILGHENRKTTEIYLHNIGEAERQAVAVLDRMRGKSHTESHTTG